MSLTSRRTRSRSILLAHRLDDRIVPAVHFMGPYPHDAFAGYAGTALESWRVLMDAPAAPTGVEQVIRPDRFLSVALDADAMRAALPDTVHTLRPDGPADRAVIALPKPDGTFERFEVYGADVVPEPVWVSTPSLRTYRGVGLDDPAATLVADFTTQGFHAQVQTPGGWWYIDPLFHGSQEAYQSYARADYTADPHDGWCGCQLCRDAIAAAEAGPAVADTAARGGVGGGPGFSLAAPGELTWGGTLRTYRAAITTDTAYFDYHDGVGSGTAAQNVLSAVTTALNRVSGIYEAELSVRFQLIPDPARVIYGAPGNPDPYTDGDAGDALDEVQARLDAVVGAANYEIGHLFSGDGDYSGLARLGVIARDGVEGSGVTGINAPVGDRFTVDYVAHEMGHQANGNHTFAGFSGASNPNKVEPGSASTIMGYAGLGGPANDYQTVSDPMLSWNSLREMSAYLSGTYDGGFTATPTGNAAPRVAGGGDYVIPARTLFGLTAAGADADGDAVSYSWEQADSRTADTGLGVPDPGPGAPLFRPYLPTSSPERSFPRTTAVLAAATNLNGSVNLDGTGSAGSGNFGYVRGERLPLTTRDLNFVVVARDGKAGGGAWSYDRVTIRSVNTGTVPFAVTLGTGLSWAGGSAQTVPWNVAGTTGNGINTAFVRILLSVDGGLTYPHVLADRTPNDGSEAVALPFVASAAGGARVRVEPTNSIYFAVSNKLTVTAGGAAPAGAVSGVSFVDRNGNGVRAGEPAAPGRLVYADADGNGRFDNGLPLVTLAGIYPLALPDRAVARVPFSLTGVGATVADLRVKLSLAHPNPGELDAFLVGPSGRRVELFTDLGSNGTADITNLVLSAAGTSGVNQTSAPYTGTFRPEGNLGEFAGEAADGVWLLEITDRVADNTGTLVGWTLGVTTEFASTAAPATLTGSGQHMLFPLTVPTLAGTVTDLDVKVNLLVGDTQSASFWLYNPTVPTTPLSPVPAGAVRLFDRFPEFNSNFNNTVFDDQAATLVSAGAGPFAGRFRPVASMAGYYDSPADPIAGTWRLNVRSEFGSFGPEFHVGYRAWSLLVTRDFPATFTPLTVPDAGTLDATLPMPLVGGPLQDVNVSLSVSHPDVSQLTAYLLSPAGTKVLLASGGTGADFTGTGFDDEAAAKFAAGTAPYAATFRPVEPLSRFDGEEASGTWTLRVVDATAGGAGTLTGFAVALTAPTRVASLGVPLAVAAATQSSPLFVSNAVGTLTDLDVTMTLSHPAVGEVTAYLIAPTGAKVTLVASPAGGGADLTATTFDDEAGTLVTAGAAPFTGRFRPAQPLSAFDGLSPNGFWRLQLDDSNPTANGGKLLDWSLTYSTGDRYAVTDAAGGYTLALPPGTYTVREELPGDLTRSQPAGGSYPVTVAAGANSFPDTSFGSYDVVVPNTPALTVDAGTGQRSVVRTLTVTGFGPITGAAAGAFTLTRTGPDAPTGPQPLAVTGTAAGPNGTTRVRLALPAIYVAFGSLIDGTYTLDVNWSLVTVAGPPLGGTSSYALHRLFGDGTGDAVVDGADYLEFVNGFGLASGDVGYNRAYDFNADAVVDGADYLEFVNRFGVSV